MKKIWSVLLSILLGAIVVGIGTGYFLYLANKDRQILANEANIAKLEAQQTLQDSQRAIEEANSKLTQANQQVAEAEQALKALKNEQALLRQAKPLLKPSNKDLDGWLSAISTSQGISLLHPPGSNIKVNNDLEFSLIQESKTSPWLKIIPYSKPQSDNFKLSISSSTNISYFIDGKVVAGIVGTESTSNLETALLEIYLGGTSTQILWIQNPPPFKFKSWQREQNIPFEEILKTFEFKK
jgi:hypothetical protein